MTVTIDAGHTKMTTNINNVALESSSTGTQILYRANVGVYKLSITESEYRRVKRLMETPDSPLNNMDKLSYL